MDGENLGQGREATRQYLKNNPELTQRLREQIIKAKGIAWGDAKVEEPDGQKEADPAKKS